MKKVILIILLLITTGCTNKTVDGESERIAKYNSLYVSCLNNGDFLPKSEIFNTSVEFVKNDDGFSYFIVIDEPKVAMYDVEAIVIEDLIEYGQEEMMPTVGVFEDFEYNLVPYQTNKENNFYGGLVISGDTTNDKVDLYALVTWKDVTMTKQFKEYILITSDNTNNTKSNDIQIEDNNDKSDE